MKRSWIINLSEKYESTATFPWNVFRDEIIGYFTELVKGQSDVLHKQHIKI